MQATRIIALRHGETAWNVDARIQGKLDIELNETGHWQARRAAQALASEEIDAVYSSDLLRAWDTACTVAGAAGQKAKPVPALRERGFGIFEGRTFTEIEATWPEQTLRWRQRDPLWKPEGGESLQELHQRIELAVSSLAERHPGEQIVLVAHGGVLDILYRLATRQNLQTPRSWNLGNATINRLLWTPEGMSLVGWADTRHLEDDEALDETST